MCVGKRKEKGCSCVKYNKKLVDFSQALKKVVGKELIVIYRCEFSQVGIELIFWIYFF